MTHKKTGIFWFTNDLRLHDNPSLMRANSLVDKLLCVFIIDNHWRSNNFYLSKKFNNNANLFLRESLKDLDKNLNAIGQRLIVIPRNAIESLNDLIQKTNATDVFRSDNTGWYENSKWDRLKQSNTGVEFHSIDSHTLFCLETLPFSLNQLPASFTKFKQSVNDVKWSQPIAKITHLPPPPIINTSEVFMSEDKSHSKTYRGGEIHGLVQLTNYFSSERASYYKEVRNSIDGWENSCKFSPWLANGCLSVRQVMSELVNYENNITSNESTYWIYFELLWREYFQWYAHKNGSKLFSITGIKRLNPLTCYYPERFQKWVHGSTPYPIVNACMNELRKTGYLSNRGRQIVASCFVNELAMDWRYGAAYFEQALLDYDVASNWGNWQYLAGVGADTRDKRHFNLDKQTQQFDPDGRYVQRWNGDVNLQALDSVDAADWPIS